MAYVVMSSFFRDFLTDRMFDSGGDSDVADKIVQFRVKSDKCPNYLDLIANEHGEPRITYTTEEKDTSHLRYMDGGHRIAERPARFAKRVTGIDDGLALSAFADACRDALGSSAHVHVFYGLDIREWYQSKNYCTCTEQHGDLYSCMSGNNLGVAGRLALYEEAASLVVKLCPECDKVQARSILWTDVDGKQATDRIYSLSAKHSASIETWRREHGIGSIYPYRTSDFRVHVPRTYEHYPYLDSMDADYFCHDCMTLGTGWHSDVDCERIESLPRPDFAEPTLTYWATRERKSARCEECGEVCHPDGTTPHRQYCHACGEYYCGFNCDGCEREWCHECDTYYQPNDEHLHDNECNDCGVIYCGIECPYRTQCRSCHEYYCGDECPNTSECEGCFAELACGEGTVCDECIECEACGEVNSDYSLLLNDGRCVGNVRDYTSSNPYQYKQCGVMLAPKYQTKALAVIPDLRPVFINLGQFPLPTLGYDQPRV